MMKSKLAIILVLLVAALSAAPARCALKAVNVPEFTLTANTEIIVPPGQSRVVNDFGLDYEIAGFGGKEGLAVYTPDNLPPSEEGAPLLMIVQGATLVKARSESALAQSLFRTGSAYAVAEQREDSTFRIVALDDGSTEIAAIAGSVKFGAYGKKSEKLEAGRRAVVSPAGEITLYDLSDDDLKKLAVAPLEYQVASSNPSGSGKKSTKTKTGRDADGFSMNVDEEEAEQPDEPEVAEMEPPVVEEAQTAAPEESLPVQKLSRTSSIDLMVPPPAPEEALYKEPYENIAIAPSVIESEFNPSMPATDDSGEGMYRAETDSAMPAYPAPAGNVPPLAYRTPDERAPLGVEGIPGLSPASEKKASRISTVSISLNNNRVSGAKENRIVATASIKDRNLRPAKGMNARFRVDPASIGVFENEHVVTDENGEASTVFVTNASLATIRASLYAECDGKESGVKLEIVSGNTPIGYEISD